LEGRIRREEDHPHQHRLCEAELSSSGGGKQAHIANVRLGTTCGRRLLRSQCRGRKSGEVPLSEIWLL
jgi:hypothetical protein